MKLEPVKYQLTTFIRYVGDAFIYPFLTLYLSFIGLENKDVGLIMMILPMVAIFINPIWSKFSRNVNYNRHFVRVLTIIEALAVIMLVNVGASTLLIALAVFIIGVSGQPLYILLDSYVITYANMENYEYSKIRIFGSIAYCVTVIVSGVVAAYDYKLAFYIGAGAFILTSMLLTWIKPLDISGNETLMLKAEPKKLFENKRYIKYTIFVTLTLATMFTFDTYFPVYLKDIYSVGEIHYGFIVSAYILVELIILFILGRVGKKVSILHLSTFMILSLAIRYGVYALSGIINIPLPIILVVTLLRGVPISVSLYMMMKMIANLVNPNNITLATIIMGSARAAFTTVLTVFGGYLTNNVAYYKYWFLLGAVLSILAFAFIDYKNGVKTIENMIE